MTAQQLCDDLTDSQQFPAPGQHEEDWASALSFTDQPLGALNPTSTRSHLVSPENAEEKGSGLYEWLRMPFGPAPAPAMMQQYVSERFGTLTNPRTRRSPSKKKRRRPKVCASSKSDLG